MLIVVCFLLSLQLSFLVCHVASRFLAQHYDKKEKKEEMKKKKKCCGRKALRNHVLNINTTTHLHTPFPHSDSLLFAFSLMRIMAPFLSHLRMVSMNNSISFNCKWVCGFYEEQIYATNAANQHQHLAWYKYPQLREKAHGNTHVECFPNQGHPGPIEGSL